MIKPVYVLFAEVKIAAMKALKKHCIDRRNVSFDRLVNHTEIRDACIRQEYQNRRSKGESGSFIKSELEEKYRLSCDRIDNIIEVKK